MINSVSAQITTPQQVAAGKKPRGATKEQIEAHKNLIARSKTKEYQESEPDEPRTISGIKIKDVKSLGRDIPIDPIAWPPENAPQAVKDALVKHVGDNDELAVKLIRNASLGQLALMNNNPTLDAFEAGKLNRATWETTEAWEQIIGTTRNEASAHGEDTKLWDDLLESISIGDVGKSAWSTLEEMTTAENTEEAIKLRPDHLTVIREFHKNTHFKS